MDESPCPCYYCLEVLPTEARERGGEAAEAAVAIAVIAVIIVLALVLLLCLSRIVALQLVRIGQRDGEVDGLVLGDAVDGKRQLVAGLLVGLDGVYLVHGRGRGAVYCGDDVADLEALRGGFGARVDRIDLNARDAAVLRGDIAAGDADE